EQYDEQCAVRIDPDGSSGEAGVPVTAGGKIVAAGTAFRGHDPPEGSGVFGERLRRGEHCDCGALHDAMVRVNAVVQKHLAESREIGRSAKDPGMARNTTDRKGV